MIEAVSTFLENLEIWVLALAASGWIYPALYAFATIDGFFPPIPSESVVITLSVAASATGNPNLVLVLIIAAAGAWTGDQIAYSLGRGVGTERFRILRTVRGRKAVLWADQALKARGAAFILAARYVPIGRVAVNMTAGAVGYPRRRFMAYSGLAAVTWAIYSVVIGLLAAQWLGHQPLLAMVIGVVMGVASGIIIDRIMNSMARKRRAREAARDAAATPLHGEAADRAAATPSGCEGLGGDDDAVRRAS